MRHEGDLPLHNECPAIPPEGFDHRRFYPFVNCTRVHLICKTTPATNHRGLPKPDHAPPNRAARVGGALCAPVVTLLLGCPY